MSTSFAVDTLPAPSPVEDVCRAVAAVRPDAIVSAYTLLGPHGTRVGTFARYCGARRLPEDEGLRRHYATAFAPVDRGVVRFAGRWVSLVAEGELSLDALAALLRRQPTLRGFDASELVVLTIARFGWPAACVTVLVPSSSPLPCETDLARMAAAAAPFKDALRRDTLLANAEASLCAVDHLLASRPDVAFLADGEGEVLGGSPAAHRLLARTPALSEHLRRTVAENPRKAAVAVVHSLGLVLSVTPCTQRGGAPVNLVSVAPHEVGGRGRITRRQAELIELVAEGLSNKEVAVRMGIAPSTVKDMLEKLYRVAGVSGRMSLIRWARQGCGPRPLAGEGHQRQGEVHAR